MSDPDPEVVSQPAASFGHLLAQYRKSAHLTQEELASAAGISVRSISDMERGRVRAPQQRTVQALAMALPLDQRAQGEFLRVAKAGRPRAHATAGAAADSPGANHHQASPASCQLPPEVADFTGREQELNRALRLVDAHPRDDRRAAPVVALFGAPGVGKTAFALHVGHRLRERYPDGQLFLDLHGMESGRLSTHQALGHLLTALGASSAQLPAGLDERSTLYRSLLADRQVLVLLDNVADDAQVRPLLPSSPGSLVLLTSRRVLSGLEAVGRMQLDVLDSAAALRLLESIIGPDRATREPAAMRRVARLCGNLPLAVRIAGNRLASRPRWPIANLVRLLSDQQHRLTALTAGDLRVRAAFEASYRQCDPVSRLVFRRLSLVSGPDVTAAQAAILAELDQCTAARHLEELVDASLLDTGVAEGRYVVHELLRLFAGERLTSEDNAAKIRSATWRLTGWLLRTGTHAGQLLASTLSTDIASPNPAALLDSAVPTPTPTDARHWLDTEQSHWLAALHNAIRTGQHADALAFCQAMRWYSGLRPIGELWREVFANGVHAATALGRRQDEAAQLNLLGWALNRIHGLNQEASRTHQRALAIAREIGDRTEQARALHHCGRTELDAGRPDQAASLFRSAIAMFHETGHTFEEHTALSCLGSALHALGRYDQAAATHRSAIAEFRQAGSVPHRNLLALGLLRLAETLEATSDWSAANATFREAGAAAIGVDSHTVEALAWFGCGRCSHEMGDLRPAEQHLDIALSIFTDIGDRWMQARVLHRRAAVLDHVDPARARANRKRALQICHQLDTARSRGLAASLSAALTAIQPQPRSAS